MAGCACACCFGGRECGRGSTGGTEAHDSTRSRRCLSARGSVELPLCVDESSSLEFADFEGTDLIQVNALIPALLAGNSVLLKPSPQTPLCGERILASLLAVGLPKDVCQVRRPSLALP